MFEINFLVIGTQKSATTWIYQSLKNHPDISLPNKKKEVQYIGGRLWEKKGDDWYFNLFNHDTTKLTGDVSVDYLCNKKSPKLLYERFPNMKFIISLRNPTERAISAYSWYWRKGLIEKNIPIDIYFSELIKNRKDFKDSFSILNRGLYERQLFNYLEYFHPSQFKVIFYDDIKKDQQTTLYSIYEFLNIRMEKKIIFYNIIPKLNSRNKILLNLERKFNDNKFLVKILQYLHNFLYSLNSKKQFSKAEMEAIKMLNNFYQPYNRSLNKFLIKEELVDIMGIKNIKWLCD